MRIRRLAALLAGGLLVAGLSLGLGGTAHASDPVVPSSTWNEIYFPFDNIANNQLCADVTNGATVPVPLQVYNCKAHSGDTAQQWHFMQNNGLLQIQNTKSGLCISQLPGHTLFNNMLLYQESCSFAMGFVIRAQNDNGTDPILELVLVDPSTHALTNLCMATANMSDQPHTELAATTCQGLAPVPGDLSQVIYLL